LPNLLICHIEFSPLRTRFEASEASVVDYYMYVNFSFLENAIHCGYTEPPQRLGITMHCSNSLQALQVSHSRYIDRLEFLIHIVRGGRQPTPPDFILGYQQSKLRYFNQSQVLDVAQRFHDEKVNVSLIVVGEPFDTFCVRLRIVLINRSYPDFFAWKFQGDW
jgi:alpha-D-xyloside xylohydrolase